MHPSLTEIQKRKHSPTKKIIPNLKESADWRLILKEFIAFAW